MYSPVVWGYAPVQHIKLPVDSVRRLSHDTYVAAFPSEVEDIHGLVYIGSTPSAVQSGVLVGDVQYISKRWSTPLSPCFAPVSPFLTCNVVLSDCVRLLNLETYSLCSPSPHCLTHVIVSTTVGLEHDHDAAMLAIDTSSGILRTGRPYDGSHSYNHFDTRLLHHRGPSISQTLSTRHAVNRVAKTVTCAVLSVRVLRDSAD